MRMNSVRLLCKRMKSLRPKLAVSLCLISCGFISLTIIAKRQTLVEEHVSAAVSENSLSRLDSAVMAYKSEKKHNIDLVVSYLPRSQAVGGGVLSRNRYAVSRNPRKAVSSHISLKRPRFRPSLVFTVLPTRAPSVPLVSMDGQILGKDFFRTVLSPAASCAGRDIELVICVSVKRDDALKRGVIRLTWGSYGQNGGRGHVKNATNSNGQTGEIILIFFIGSSALLNSTAEQKDIENEARHFGDIHQADFIDTYKNLTLKSISILQYISSHCPNARYIAKVDDDVYVNVSLLLTTLRNQRPKRPKPESKATHDKNAMRTATFRGANDSSPPPFALGCKFDRAKPIRDKKNKWYTSEESYRSKRYPSYLSGTAYFMSGRAALRVYMATLKTPVFWLEDIYITGMCARKVRVPLVSNQKLITDVKLRAHACSFKDRITAHRYSAWEIVKIHESLKDPHSKC